MYRDPSITSRPAHSVLGTSGSPGTIWSLQEGTESVQIYHQSTNSKAGDSRSQYIQTITALKKISVALEPDSSIYVLSPMNSQQH